MNNSRSAGKPISVILDTDIGGDIDDTWALAFMLRCPELDVKLVVSDTGDTAYRAQIVARLLEVAGRTDVPIGVGTRQDFRIGDRPQGAWVESYELADYPGKVHEDGVSALIDAVMSSPEPITLLCIGPVPNIAEALEREPRIAQRARFVGMHGSVRRGYGGAGKIDAEYNVAQFTKQCQKAFTAAWPMTITPLDTCGLVVLDGAKYRAVRESRDPLAQAVIENYRHWLKWHKLEGDIEVKSSVLFDTVAVYLAFSDELLVMEKLGIRVSDDGYTLIDEHAKEITCAMAWKDMGAFEYLLVKRLTTA
ncbi:MAG TPA: nucleoside hydrolase [Planctomycetota bacterium]|nr:nucleoside hydrolase [Planctomycetota bacterium]